jgi:hypothetical protein
VAHAGFGTAKRSGMSISGPHKIRFETAHYIVRTVEIADASESWGQWLTRAETAHMLNTQARHAAIEEIRKYIASFDGHNRHLIGIFQKDGGAHVGIWAFYVDWIHREFMVNVLVGEVDARGRGAREETRPTLYRFFFETLGMEAARCTVLAHNVPTLRVMDRDGWMLTDTQYKASAAGGAPLEVRGYRLSRDTWARKTGEKAQAAGA